MYHFEKKLLKEIVERSNSPIGIIDYDIATFEPRITKEAVQKEDIDVEQLDREIERFKPRSWLFWMDITLEEVGTMLKKIAEVENRNLKGNIKKIVLEEFWNETLSSRFSGSTRSSSYQLNYQLFFDSLNLWTDSGKLTVLGNRLYEICKKYGEICKKYGNDSKEFRDALHYTILTEGGYLKMLIYIDKIQITKNFELKGSSDELNRLIREIKENLGTDRNDLEAEMNQVLPIYEEKAPNCWLKIVGIELYKMGFGRSLTQMNEELTRRFGPYFQKSLKTDFYIGKFIKNKGYIIDWERIISLIERGEKNLNIF
ncbi:MAG: hypothetical protein ACTSYB_01915 [Candidatus Helarchaeota archaeon]